VGTIGEAVAKIFMEGREVGNNRELLIMKILFYKLGFRLTGKCLKRRV
jgi:hypothetical protein